MICRRWVQRRARVVPDERGASMVLALVFVTVFGMAMSATLGYADTAFRTNQVTQARQASIYGAGGALDTAINAMRPVLEWGRAGGPCTGVEVDLVDGVTASVACTPVDGSGVGSPLAVGVDATTPDHALLTRAKVAEPGVNVRSGKLTVSGPVVVSSAIDTASGSTFDAGSATVRAAGTCSVGQIAAGTVTCSTPVGAEITAALAKVGVPSWKDSTARSAPDCAGAGRYHVLAPGRYTSATELSELTNGECPGAVLHLLPGRFHMDFAERGFAAQWRVTDPTVTIVAGSAKGWTPPADGAAAPVVPTSGACDVTTAGSILTFSSESAWYVGGARNVEVCGAEQANGQRVAILGPWASMGLPEAQLQRRCVALPRGCPFLMVTSADAFADGVLRVHGTVLAPTGTIGVDARNGAVAQFNRGALVRSVYSWGTQTVGPVFTVTSGVSGGYADREVVLVVTIDGQRAGRAKVRFGDESGSDPGATVTILEWNATL